MQNKPLLIGIIVVVLVAGGIVAAAVAKQNSNKRLAADQNEKQAMMKKDKMAAKEGSMADQEKDKTMMDDSHILGVVMVSGKLMTLWPMNELANLSHDVTLKNGTVVTKDGKITTSTGSVITLKDGQELTTDGAILTVDVSKMMMMKEGAMTEKTGAMKEEGAMMAKHGSYLDYSADTVAAEQKAGHKVVLYFYAPWCPFCRVADTAFKARPDQIPTGVTVLKTDYDSSTALKQKYGVNYQHTFVQIDSNGNLITKWVSGDTDLLIKNVK